MTEFCRNVLLAGVCMVVGLGVCAAPKKKTPVWTDPNADNIPPSFQYQGEYSGGIKGGDKLGCQIIALSKDAFHAVVQPGGLPGDGWDGKNKILMDGKIEGDKVIFKPAAGNKKYNGGPPAEFSATVKFPPQGHKPYSAVISGDTMTGKTDDGKEFELKKVIRESDTLGMKPPKDAVVLFDGSSKDAFNGGRLDEKTKLLNTDGRDIRTKQKFSSYIMHLEFFLPFRPDARGQGRSNSGFYQIDMYEVQILGSMGLEAFDNECGGIYKKGRPKVNMCFPPLQWQTYDVEFTNAVAENGKKTSNARISLRHNGVLIYDNFEINGKTGGARKDPEGTPGPIKLQGHGNPLQFRNIWIAEKK